MTPLRSSTGATEKKLFHFFSGLYDTDLQKNEKNKERKRTMTHFHHIGDPVWAGILLSVIEEFLCVYRHFECGFLAAGEPFSAEAALIYKAVFRITGHGATSTLHQHRSNAIKYFLCRTISNRRAGAVFETFFFSDNVLNIPFQSQEMGWFRSSYLEFKRLAFVSHAGRISGYKHPEEFSENSFWMRHSRLGKGKNTVKITLRTKANCGFVFIKGLPQTFIGVATCLMWKNHNIDQHRATIFLPLFYHPKKVAVTITFYQGIKYIPKLKKETLKNRKKTTA